MQTRLIALFFIGAMTMSAAGAQSYAEGQIWSYKARPGEEGSTLLINKIEHDARVGPIYHISVAGVSVKNRQSPGAVQRDLPHFPVAERTLDASCVALVGNSSPNPAYLKGYTLWKQAFDQHQAGIFTVSVAEIVGAIESAVR
jgi:hypothetical protein